MDQIRKDLEGSALSGTVGSQKSCETVPFYLEVEAVHCDELTVLSFGTVLSQGDTKTVLQDPKVITAYIGG